MRARLYISIYTRKQKRPYAHNKHSQQTCAYTCAHILRIFTYMHIYIIHIYIKPHRYTQTTISTYIYTGTYTHIHTNICMHTCTKTRIGKYTHNYSYILTYIHIHKLVHAHLHIYTYTNIQKHLHI